MCLLSAASFQLPSRGISVDRHSDREIKKEGKKERSFKGMGIRRAEVLV